MTTVRRLIFPLFVTCVALAVGIALGTGPLRGSSAEGDSSAAGDTAALADQVSALEEGQEFAEAASSTAASKWLDGSVATRGVTLVVLPGVSKSRVRAAEAAIAQTGGGTLAATVTIDPDYVDPAKKTYVDTVADQSLQSAADLKALADAETYQQIGALVARAYVGHLDAAAFDEQASQIDSELAGAKLLDVAEAPTVRGSVTVVLAPGGQGESAAFDARNTIVGELVIALAKQGDGTVVVTPPAGAEPGGVIGSLEADPQTKDLKLSTLNVSEGIAAQAAALRALQAAINGKPGTYGIVDGEVVLPPGI